MTILITRGEVIQCVKQELKLAGIVDKKHAAPDLRQLLPELKFTRHSAPNLRIKLA